MHTGTLNDEVGAFYQRAWDDGILIGCIIALGDFSSNGFLDPSVMSHK